MNFCCYCTHWTEDERDAYKGQCDYLSTQVEVIIDLPISPTATMETQAERPRFVTEADFGCQGYDEKPPAEVSTENRG